MIERKLAAVCIAFTLLALPGLGFANDSPGAAIVERLHGTLHTMMVEANTLGYDGRLTVIEPVLNETFDFATISRIVTGRAWKDLDAGRRENFVRLFGMLSAATYASNFSSYDGERFETLSTEEQRGSLLVKSVLIKRDGERVTLDYVLRKRDDVWRIVNVIAQGVSDLSLKRADYTAVIKSEGFDSLIAKLNGKVASYGESGR